MERGDEQDHEISIAKSITSTSFGTPDTPFTIHGTDPDGGLATVNAKFANLLEQPAGPVLDMLTEFSQMGLLKKGFLKWQGFFSMF